MKNKIYIWLSIALLIHCVITLCSCYQYEGVKLNKHYTIIGSPAFVRDVTIAIDNVEKIDAACYYGFKFLQPELTTIIESNRLVEYSTIGQFNPNTPHCIYIKYSYYKGKPFRELEAVIVHECGHMKVWYFCGRDEYVKTIRDGTQENFVLNNWEYKYRNAARAYDLKHKFGF